MPAGIAAVGTDLYEIVGIFDDVEMVLDDEDGVAFVDESMEELDESFDVGEVQADGGFFEDIEVALTFAVVAFAEAGESAG
ncbi:hypothetical protein [Coraliomargarita parva]|uniref:hypothetical protein n=1 Tax=Coraliomargarita parva TaxID=3014050 RepID=UPI0022B2EC60|nr:hypothetical protein [Coraliomargarita parva]